MRLLIIALLSLLLFSAQSFSAAPEILFGKVVGVHDGDTITVLTAEKKSFKIRLAEIDTPESKQPYNMFLIHFWRVANNFYCY